MFTSLKSLFGKRDPHVELEKKQEKLEKKYGLSSGGSER